MDSVTVLFELSANLRLTSNSQDLSTGGILGMKSRQNVRFFCRLTCFRSD